MPLRVGVNALEFQLNMLRFQKAQGAEVDDKIANTLIAMCYDEGRLLLTRSPGCKGAISPRTYDAFSTATEEEALRAALTWRRKYEDLWDAVDTYRLWEPGRRGYAAARRELERVWLDEEAQAA